MANRYWVGGTGTWNNSTTTNWSATTGGAGGASVPSSSDDVIFDANSSLIITTVVTIASTAACNNLTITGPAVKILTFTLTGNFSPSGSVTINGNSAINRLIFQSSTIGTPRTITIATLVSLTNVDFIDITGAGAAAPFTGTSLGNALGNTNITFDTPVTQTHTTSAGGNWSDATKWTSRVPLPQDDVIIDVNTTGTLTADMPRLGKSINFTGFTGTGSFGTTPNSIYGSLTLASGMTVSGIQVLTLAGRGAHTITSAGKTFTQGVAINGFGGTYTLQDNFSGGNFTWNNGTLTANNFNVTIAATLGSPSPGPVTINMGSGTWTLNSTAGSPWFVSGTVNINASTSTIIFNAASASARTFGGGGKTYGTLTYTVAGSTGTLAITGANTFNTINFSDVTNARTLTLPSATTTAVTNFNVNGTSGKLMTINSSTPANAATLTKPSGVISLDYLSIQDSNATGGAAWFAGANSTRVSNVTGWNFSPAIELSGSFFHVM